MHKCEAFGCPYGRRELFYFVVLFWKLEFFYKRQIQKLNIKS